MVMRVEGYFRSGTTRSVADSRDERFFFGEQGFAGKFRLGPVFVVPSIRFRLTSLVHDLRTNTVTLSDRSL